MQAINNQQETNKSNKHRFFMNSTAKNQKPRVGVVSLVKYFAVKTLFATAVSSSRFKNGTSLPIIRCATFLYAIPASDFSSFTIGSPLFVEVIMPVSSGIIPINSAESISTTSSTLIISLDLISFGRTLFNNKWYDLISSLASNRPIILSASRIADISGVVTTIASLAPATAF